MHIRFGGIISEDFVDDVDFFSFGEPGFGAPAGDRLIWGRRKVEEGEDTD